MGQVCPKSQSVTKLVGRDVAKAQRVVGSVKIKRILGVDNHVAKIGRIVVSENAAVGIAIAVDTDAADADVAAHAQLTRRLRAKGRAVIGGFVDDVETSAVAQSFGHQRELGQPSVFRTVNHVETRLQIAGRAGVVGIAEVVANQQTIAHKAVGDGRRIALFQAATVGRGARPAPLSQGAERRGQRTAFGAETFVDALVVSRDCGGRTAGRPTDKGTGNIGNRRRAELGHAQLHRRRQRRFDLRMIVVVGLRLCLPGSVSQSQTSQRRYSARFQQSGQ